jgi:hypothetical protein
MDPFYNEEEYHDATPADSLSESDLGDSSPAGDDEMRLARIGEYRQESLRKENTLQANMALVNCGLLELVFLSEKALKNACRSAGGTFLETPHGQRAVRTHLHIARQVDRFANFDARLEEAKKQDANAKAQRRVAAMQAPAAAKYPMR